MIETATIESPKRRGRPKKVRIEPVSEPEEQAPEPESALPEPFEIDAEKTIEGDPREDIPPYPALPAFSSVDRILSVWNALSDRQREFGNLYLYRDWPKMLLVLKHNRLVNENCDKFTVLDGPITLDAIRQRRRIGKYTIRLVQRVVKPYGQLSQAEFKIDGNMENVEDMPILDIEKLDRKHPDNDSYLRILKLRGIIKVDGNTNEGEEMAASEVLGNLTSKALDMLGDRSQTNGTNPGNPAVVVDGGVGKELVGLLRDQIQQNRAPESQGTVADYAKSLVELAKTMTPAPQDMSAFISSQDRYTALVERMMLKDVERAEAEAKKAREEAEAFKNALPKPLSVDEQFDQLERAAKRYERITGKGKKDEEDEEAKENPQTGAGLLGTLLGNLPLIERGLAHAANIVSIWKTGRPLSPPPLAAHPNPAANGNAPAQTIEEEDPLPEAQMSPEAQAQMQAISEAMNSLTGPLLMFFGAGRPGTELAKLICDLKGVDKFKEIQNLQFDAVDEATGQQKHFQGKQAIGAVIEGFPPIWDSVKNELPRFNVFLDEFLSYKPVPPAVQ